MLLFRISWFLQTVGNDRHISRVILTWIPIALLDKVRTSIDVWRHLCFQTPFREFFVDLFANIQHILQAKLCHFHHDLTFYDQHDWLQASRLYRYYTGTDWPDIVHICCWQLALWRYKQKTSQFSKSGPSFAIVAFYRLPTELLERNVFSHVCLSVCLSTEGSPYYHYLWCIGPHCTGLPAATPSRHGTWEPPGPLPLVPTPVPSPPDMAHPASEIW